MKTTINNTYFDCISFPSFRDMKQYLENQSSTKKLVIDDTFGDYHYCVVGHDSLSKNKLFIIGFSSNKSEKDIIIFHWAPSGLMVLDISNELILFQVDLTFVKKITVTTPLVGLHAMANGMLLVLEEAALKLD